MDPTTAKAASVHADGTEDGFTPGTGYWQEQDWSGTTRLVVSVSPERLAATHQALIGALQPPLSLLYRQVTDRRDPQPEGSPPRDLVAIDLPVSRLLSALGGSAALVYHDARAEYWLRGGLGDQVVLDGDGVVFCYPDDPAFRAVLAALDIPEAKVEVLEGRDYVVHRFHAECDAEEDALIRALALTEVPHRR